MISRRRAVPANRPLLPRQWLRHLRTSVLAAACGIGLAAGVWYAVPRAFSAVRSHRYFAVAVVSVDGNRRLTRRDVLDWIGVHDGGSVWDGTPGKLRLRLQSHPWIAHARVRRELPNRLYITVEERRPVAIVRLDTFNYVDRDGRILGPLRTDDSRDFPLITGLQKAGAEDFMPIGLHRALRLLRLCQRLNCFDAISEVLVDHDRGVTVFPLRPAVAVVLGWGDWHEKLTRSARVFAAWEGQTARLASVDVTFRDLVVVKLREEPPASRHSKRGVRV